MADADRMTAGGEINKLASNIGLARDFARIHWRSDFEQGLLLGEAVALSVLRDQRNNYAGENFAGFTITNFGGTSITVWLLRYRSADHAALGIVGRRSPKILRQGCILTEGFPSPTLLRYPADNQASRWRQRRGVQFQGRGPVRRPDVCGYSHLMGIDEEGTLAALQSLRRDLVDPKTTAGLLVEFAASSMQCVARSVSRRRCQNKPTTSRPTGGSGFASHSRIWAKRNQECRAAVRPFRIILGLGHPPAAPAGVARRRPLRPPRIARTGTRGLA